MTITLCRQLALGLALLATPPVPALAQDGSGGAMQHPMPMAGGNSAQGADAEFHHGMMTMQHDMNVKMTGDPDQDFVAIMIPHHQGAVDMAKVELKYRKDPELKRLAQDIVKAQDEEIKLMRDWQAKHPR